MRVEARRIDVENFSLAGENCEDGLDTVKLFAITEIDVLNEMIKDFDQVGEEVDVDDVGESVEERIL
jgi:hypothetical protein